MVTRTRPRQRVLGAWDSRSPIRRARHGLTADEIDLILVRQGGRCAICGTATPGIHGWNIDHDHRAAEGHPHPTNVGCRLCFRGILCGACNDALGDELGAVEMPQRGFVMALADRWIGIHRDGQRPGGKTRRGGPDPLGGIGQSRLQVGWRQAQTRVAHDG
jgi:hypothetical protein